MLTLAQAEQFVQKVCMDHRIPAPRITRHAPSALRRGAKSLHLGRGITREALRDQLAFYLGIIYFTPQLPCKESQNST